MGQDLDECARIPKLGIVRMPLRDSSQLAPEAVGVESLAGEFAHDGVALALKDETKLPVVVAAEHLCQSVACAARREQEGASCFPRTQGFRERKEIIVMRPEEDA